MKPPPGLRAWPLLTAGIALLLGDTLLLLGNADRPMAAALLLGVGAVMAGAGIANVIRSPHDPAPRKDDDSD